MDGLMKLPRDVQVVLGAGVLLLIDSFLNWQQYRLSFGIIGGTIDLSEWGGVGILAALLTVALVVWETARLFSPAISIGSLPEGVVSLLLALLVGLFTVITFLTHSAARHWPAWVGLILAIVIAVAAWSRARREGVQLPEPTPTGGTSE
jgi:hypothetical protein